MLKIIVCEDNETFMKKNVNCINLALVNTDIDYRIIKFSGYSNKLNDIINEKGVKKIYILDVEMINVSGLEIASRIRENDFDSIIIFATAYDKYQKDIFYSRLMVLDFICKYNGYEERLKDSIIASIKVLYCQKTFNFMYNHVAYRIPYTHICYIEKEPLIKRCIIHTINNNFYICKSINWLENNLASDFIKTHQSCIVNGSNIKSIDYANHIITFKNGDSTELLTNDKKKEVKKYVPID